MNWVRASCSLPAMAFIISGCQDVSAPLVLPASAAPVAPSASSTLRPRIRTYYAINEEDVCVVYWQEPTRASIRKIIPCPREIDAGERLRLAGRTCMREAAESARNIPVRCPKQVLAAEYDDRNGQGEYLLVPRR